jgi:hypothetical protein
MLGIRKEGLTPLIMALRPDVITPYGDEAVEFTGGLGGKGLGGKDACHWGKGCDGGGVFVGERGDAQLREPTRAALHNAITGRNLEAARWLVLHGAEVDDASRDLTRRYGDGGSGKNEMLEFISKCHGVNWARLPTWKSELAVPVPCERRNMRASVRSAQDVQLPETKLQRKQSVSTESSGMVSVWVHVDEDWKLT